MQVSRLPQRNTSEIQGRNPSVRILLPSLYFSMLNAVNKAILFLARLSFHPLRRSDVVIFDKECSEELILNELKPYSVFVLDTRGGIYYVIPVFLGLLSALRGREKFRLAYYGHCIALIKPSVVITLIDNNAEFYALKRMYPAAKYCFVQNGRRSFNNDIFSALHATRESGYELDRMFVFANPVGDLYKTYVSGTYESIGSYRLNQRSRSLLPLSDITKGILYISNWRKKSSLYFCRSSDGTLITHDDFFKANALLFEHLTEWCSCNGVQLTTLSSQRCKLRANHEQKFYDKHCHPDFNYEFLVLRDTDSPYDILANYSCIVGVDSTLCLESLRMGYKTVFYHCRGSLLGWPDWNYGWPSVQPENSGAFWTNSSDKEEFLNILQHIYNMPLHDWKELLNQSEISNAIELDHGNSKLILYLNQEICP
ncbi:LA_1612 family putative O-antigen biosynthesis protein [Synechococcus sp. LTW-R]|uniref:LA_1612 family putative O-antigen biosynthesis protein n=1 Tax=Synechococcus sp. LTW-R TaxID=2751170 RepID=UPI001623E094|nr:LA_1612 family putative O-antigen biosynthesis protein [Synechococcus sp. LTW-R]QNG28945.1 hypothetical protein H0O22_09345 [Synechococcus sp. LTW-R]